VLIGTAGCLALGLSSAAMFLFPDEMEPVFAWVLALVSRHRGPSANTDEFFLCAWMLAAIAPIWLMAFVLSAWLKPREDRRIDQHTLADTEVRVSGAPTEPS
jgi:hypothetical protein